MQIITNKVPRQLVYWHELTPAEQKDFDYLDTEEKQECAAFFRYRGQVYDMGEFMRIEKNSFGPYWHGYSSDTFFSGIVIHLCDDSDYIVAGLYLS